MASGQIWEEWKINQEELVAKTRFADFVEASREHLYRTYHYFNLNEWRKTISLDPRFYQDNMLIFVENQPVNRNCYVIEANFVGFEQYFFMLIPRFGPPGRLMAHCRRRQAFDLLRNFIMVEGGCRLIYHGNGTYKLFSSKSNSLLSSLWSLSSNTIFTHRPLLSSSSLKLGQQPQQQQQQQQQPVLSLLPPLKWHQQLLQSRDWLAAWRNQLMVSQERLITSGKYAQNVRHCVEVSRHKFWSLVFAIQFS